MQFDVKFYWCLGHHANGRFIIIKGDRRCIDCGHLADKTQLGDAR